MRALVIFLMACAPPYGPSQRATSTGTRSVVQLAAADQGTCALLSDGSVRCWGSWPSGEAQLAPTELAGFSAAVSIAARGDRVCAIDDEAEVSCGTLSSRARAVGIRGATELALAENTACARLTNGDVVCWSDEQKKIVARGALELVADRGSYAARLDDGRVLAWDADSVVEELEVDSVTKLFATRHALCARLWDGSTWCSGIFGDDVPAQLTGDFVDSAGDCALSAEATVGCGGGDGGIEALRNVVQVVAGEGHHCALSADGDVWCWGSNAGGQLGEQVSATPHPIEVELAAGARSISVASDVSCAAGPRGVFCWGEPQHGMFEPRSPLRRAAAVAGDALAFNGSVVCGYSTGSVQCDGGGGFRIVRHDGSPLRVTGDVLFAGGLGVAVVNDGRPIWWRASLAPSKLRPAALVDLRDIVELAYQERSWLALQKDGAVLAQTCGEQICAPSSALAACPILEGVSDLAASGNNACVIRDGRIACWGSAFEGAAPSCHEHHEPSRVAGVAGATRVAVGAQHACALVDGGRVACWGDNDWGQVGSGDFVTRPQATHVSDLHDAVELALGDRHSCARLDSGEVHCWGDMRFGQMGDGVRRIRSAPLRIRGLGAR